MYITIFHSMDFNIRSKGIMISIRTLQRNEGDFSDLLRYIFSGSLDEAILPCPPVRPLLRKLFSQA